MAKRGIILMNLGSPDSTSVPDLRKYLTQFLMDEKVIDKPWLLRTLLVKGLIVPFRSPKSAEAYQKIWWPEGSPLIVLTERLKTALTEKLSDPLSISMRYGNPTPKAAYEALLKEHPDLEEVVLVPLYPHYAMSSFETAVDYMKAAHQQLGYRFALKTIAPFYNNPGYINALAESIRPYLQQDYDQLLFSYHGIPERHVLKSDPTGHHCMQTPNCCYTKSDCHATCYRHQVTMTSELVAKKLGLPRTKWQQSYQSRLGRDPWLQPNTQVRLPQLPGEGVKKLLVVCPSFVSDCLETLEEIEIRGKEDFLNSGGSSYTYIPCMNVQPLWVNALAEIIQEVR